jgi:hypothetical protein
MRHIVECQEFTLRNPKVRVERIGHNRDVPAKAEIKSRLQQHQKYCHRHAHDDAGVFALLVAKDAKCSFDQHGGRVRQGAKV